MTGTPHRATAEQWDRLQRRRLASDHVSAIIELRARVEALEAGATPPEPAPAGSLIEVVVDAITDASAAYGTADEPARAAIRAVAEWLRGQQVLGARAWAWHLEQEVER